MAEPAQPPAERHAFVSEIQVWAGVERFSIGIPYKIIEAIKISYVEGDPITLGREDKMVSENDLGKFEVPQGEYLKSIYASVGGGTDALMFETNRGTLSRWFGGEKGSYHRDFHAPDDSHIVGFTMPWSKPITDPIFKAFPAPPDRDHPNSTGSVFVDASILRDLRVRRLRIMKIEPGKLMVKPTASQEQGEQIAERLDTNSIMLGPDSIVVPVRQQDDAEFQYVPEPLVLRAEWNEVRKSKRTNSYIRSGVVLKSVDAAKARANEIGAVAFTQQIKAGVQKYWFHFRFSRKDTKGKADDSLHEFTFFYRTKTSVSHDTYEAETNSFYSFAVGRVKSMVTPANNEFHVPKGALILRATWGARRGSPQIECTEKVIPRGDSEFTFTACDDQCGSDPLEHVTETTSAGLEKLLRVWYIDGHNIFHVTNKREMEICMSLINEAIAPQPQGHRLTATRARGGISENLSGLHVIRALAQERGIHLNFLDAQLPPDPAAGSRLGSRKAGSRAMVPKPLEPIPDTYAEPNQRVIQAIFEGSNWLADFKDLVPDAELGRMGIQRVCISGEQSVGKSTLLEYLTQTPCAFKAESVGTTRPIVYHTVRDPGANTVIFEWNNMQVTKQQLQANLVEAMQPNGTPVFSDRQVEVKIRSSTATTMLIVDLPGFQAQDEENAQIIERINHRWLDQPTSLIIAVRDQQTDWESDGLARRLGQKGCDPHFHRTIVVTNRARDGSGGLEGRGLPTMLGLRADGTPKFGEAPRFWVDLVRNTNSEGHLRRPKPVPDDPDAAGQLCRQAQDEVAAQVRGNANWEEMQRQSKKLGFGIESLVKYVQFLVVGDGSSVTEIAKDIENKRKLLQELTQNSAHVKFMMAYAFSFRKLLTSNASVRNKDIPCFSVEMEHDFDEVTSGVLASLEQDTVLKKLKFELQTFDSSHRMGGPSLKRLVEWEIPTMVHGAALEAPDADEINSVIGTNKDARFDSKVQAAENFLQNLLKGIWTGAYNDCLERIVTTLLMMSDHVFAHMKPDSHDVEYSRMIDDAMLRLFDDQDWRMDVVKFTIEFMKEKVEAPFRSGASGFFNAMTDQVGKLEPDRCTTDEKLVKRMQERLEQSRRKFVEDMRNSVTSTIRKAFEADPQFEMFLVTRLSQSLAAGASANRMERLRDLMGRTDRIIESLRG